MKMLWSVLPLGLLGLALSLAGTVVTLTEVTVERAVVPSRVLKKSAAVVLGCFRAVREIKKANVSGLYERLPDGQSGPHAQDHAFISSLLAKPPIS